MARFKVNIFFVFSIVCTLALIGYAWLVFLPFFEGAEEYSSIRNMVILITIMFIAVSCIQLFLSIRREEIQEEEPNTAPREAAAMAS